MMKLFTTMDLRETFDLNKAPFIDLFIQTYVHSSKNNNCIQGFCSNSSISSSEKVKEVVYC